MATNNVCALGSLSTVLEDLQRAQSSAAEEHERNMRTFRSQTESRITELAVKIMAQEKLNLEHEAEKARQLEQDAEAQRLLAMVKRLLELQQAQETKRVELVKKHKEETENFEALLQEQCKRLQRVAERLEPEKEGAEKIAELEEKLKELEEDFDFKNDLVHVLTMSLRQFTDDFGTATAAVLSSKFLEVCGTTEIGVKKLGELNTTGWHAVCGHKFSTPENFTEWTSEIDQELRTQTLVPPLKRVPDGNNEKLKYMIDTNDKWLTKLRNQYGPIVADAVGTAALEIETWNSSGRYIVPMPWDYRKNKRASMSSIFQHLLKLLNEKSNLVQRKVKEVQEKAKEVQEKVKEVQAKVTEVEVKKREIQEKETHMNWMSRQLDMKDKVIEERDKQIKALNRQLKALSGDGPATKKARVA